MKLLLDERSGIKRRIVRTRPIKFKNGIRGIRVELEFDGNLCEEMNKPILLTEGNYNKLKSITV